MSSGLCRNYGAGYLATGIGKQSPKERSWPWGTKGISPSLVSLKLRAGPELCRTLWVPGGAETKRWPVAPVLVTCTLVALAPRPSQPPTPFLGWSGHFPQLTPHVSGLYPLLTAVRILCVAVFGRTAHRFRSCPSADNPSLRGTVAHDSWASIHPKLGRVPSSWIKFQVF